MKNTNQKNNNKNVSRHKNQKNNLPMNIFKQKIKKLATFIIIVLSAIAPIFCGGFEYSYTLPVCFILLLCSYIIFLWTKETPNNKTFSFITFIILIASLLLTVFSYNVYSSLGSVILLATGIFLTLISSIIFKDKKLIIIFAIVLSIICGLLSIWFFRESALGAGGGSLFWEKLSTGRLDRVFGTFLNPNFYAGYLTMVFPISIGLIFIFKDAKYKILMGFLSVFILINICLTGSKFGLIALFFGLLSMIISLFITKAFSKDTIKPLIILFISCAIFFCIFSQTLILRIESAGNTQVHSIEFRIETWKATFNIIKNNPIFGVFPGRFSETFPSYAIASLTKHAHNTYLQFASEYGIILSVLLLICLLIIIKNILKTKKECEKPANVFSFIDIDKLKWLYCGFIGSFVAVLCHNLADSDLYICSILFIFALICGVFLSFDSPAKTGKGFINIYQNLLLIYILGSLWLLCSVIPTYNHYYTKDFNLQTKSYKIFPENYLALRDMARMSLNENNRLEYLKKAKEKASRDYYSYQLLGDFYSQTGNIDLAIANYEKALKYHPHSTLIMNRIINLAKDNHRDDIVDKYNQKLIDQEDSKYEKIKGIPEIVDTSYAEAHIYYGDKCLNEENKENAIYHYKKAKERYEKWLKPENIDFLIISLVNGQRSIPNYEDNEKLYNYTCSQLEKLENKTYEEEKSLFKDKVDYVIKEYKALVDVR